MIPLSNFTNIILLATATVIGCLPVAELVEGLPSGFEDVFRQRPPDASAVRLAKVLHQDRQSDQDIT